VQQQHTEVAGWAVRVVQANDVVDSERQHLGPSPPGRVAEVEEAGSVGDEEDAVAGAVDLEAAFVPDEGSRLAPEEAAGAPDPHPVVPAGGGLAR
jgi:hypothetical protein